MLVPCLCLSLMVSVSWSELRLWPVTDGALLWWLWTSILWLRDIFILIRGGGGGGGSGHRSKSEVMITGIPYFLEVIVAERSVNCHPALSSPPSITSVRFTRVSQRDKFFTQASLTVVSSGI